MFEPTQPIGESPEWLAALEHVSSVAPLERPILVIGERGTGKELIGERLHFLSRRWDGPFVKVNCAALSEDLLDSELFGHEQGAFTGATRRRAGRFEQADNGTIFLDEIATASMQVQEKLLRIIEYGEFQRLGGEDVLTCDVRVVAATNVDLPAKVETGEFRADLLDRLAFDVITLPPLRARYEDISLLADHFGHRMAREIGQSFPGLAPDTIRALEMHDWPGNVRELKNVAERLTHLSLQKNPGQPVLFDGDALDPFSSPWRPQMKKATTATPMAAPRETPSKHHLPPPPDLGPYNFETEVALFERRMISEALEECEGHQGKAADLLTLTYHQFRGLLKKYNIEPKAFKPGQIHATPRPSM